MSRLGAALILLRGQLPDLVAGFGVLAVSFGAWLVTPPAGWIVLGIACLVVVRFGTEAT